MSDAERPELHGEWIERRDNCSSLPEKFQRLGGAKLVSRFNRIFLENEFVILVFVFFSAENTSQLITSKFKNQKKSRQVFPRSKS